MTQERIDYSDSPLTPSVRAATIDDGFTIPLSECEEFRDRGFYTATQTYYQCIIARELIEQNRLLREHFEVT